MLIDCPTCARSYHVNRDAIGETGRGVVCQFCDARWFVEPPTVAAADAGTGETAADDASAGPAAAAAPGGEAPATAEIESRTSDTGLSAAELSAAESREAGSARAETADGPEVITPSPGTIELESPGSRIFPDEPVWISRVTKPVVPSRGRIRADRRFSAPLARRGASPLRQAAAVAACLILAMGLIGKRNAIVHAIPATGALYAAVGLPVNVRGLEFRQVTTARPDAGGTAVEVSGTIQNVAHRRVSVPRLTFDIRNPSGAVLASWTENAPRHSLGSGESLTFTAKTAALPEGYKDIAVRFSDEAPVANLREVVAQAPAPVQLQTPARAQPH